MNRSNAARLCALASLFWAGTAFAQNVPSLPAPPQALPIDRFLAADDTAGSSGSAFDAYQPAAAPDRPAADRAASDGAPQSSASSSTTGSSATGEDCTTFFQRLYKAYFGPEQPADPNAPEPARRGLPEPWSSPPFPGHEFQGYPLIGVPPSSDAGPLMQAIYGGPCGEEIKDSRIKFEGWVTGSGNVSTSKNSNVPSSYWIVPNSIQLDQLVFKLSREVDTVQTDHIDIGFRSIIMYGMDYRYTTAGGWFSNQLLLHNDLYGWDPVEQYMDVYVPGLLEGTVIRVGRWIACPDIETQYAPDNYMGSHSILFTYDSYTQTGVMITQKLNAQWMVQGAIHAGTDMAPWYQGATPCGFFGLRWVAEDNNDSIYTCLNNIDTAEFRHFEVDGQPAGHDNYNYIVSTWTHRFTKTIHTSTEAYFMWQRDAELGGTPSLGPLQPFGGGGGNGALLPGMSLAYGVLNFTEFALSKKDYISIRNEWYRDERGMRTGYPGTYTSDTIGLSHNFTSAFQIRPEVGYYRNWDEPAFDNGTMKGMWMAGFDATMHF